MNFDLDHRSVLPASGQCFHTVPLPDNTELGSVIEKDTSNQVSKLSVMRIVPRPMVHRHPPGPLMWLAGHRLVRYNFGAHFQDHFER